MGQVALTDPATIYVAAGPPIHCYKCGIVFWMTQQLYKRLVDDHDTFYCPMGHTQGFYGESDADKYKRLYKNSEDRVAAVRAERDQAESSRRAWKGQATKARNRAVKGECVVCGQHVYQLSRHMTRKHPDEQVVTTDA